ncbi:hypothetical protein DY000_02009435 [Brassica cretica]|uniref:Uncharacterized protein n=1 Tax=Brassica cretica TaxID=69181 RepID=A0ABQ7CJ99_BRACR|nr:hypothetical protein DY000_02009435 [Brassica cretica]
MEDVHIVDSLETRREREALGSVLGRAEAVAEVLDVLLCLHLALTSGIRAGHLSYRCNPEGEDGHDCFGAEVPTTEVPTIRKGPTTRSGSRVIRAGFAKAVQELLAQEQTGFKQLLIQELADLKLEDTSEPLEAPDSIHSSCERLIWERELLQSGPRAALMSSRIRNALELELIRWTRAGTPCRNKRRDQG